MTLTTYQWTAVTPTERIQLQSRTAQDRAPRSGEFYELTAYMMARNHRQPARRVRPSIRFEIKRIQRRGNERIVALELASTHDQRQVAEVLQRIYRWQTIH